jgi:hypothetical protein
MYIHMYVVGAVYFCFLTRGRESQESTLRITELYIYTTSFVVKKACAYVPSKVKKPQVISGNSKSTCGEVWTKPADPSPLSITQILV